MIKRKFVIITMSRESFDYDLLLNYLKDNLIVYSLNIISSGFFIELVYDKEQECYDLMKLVRSLEVKDVVVHPVMDKTFLSDILRPRNIKHVDLHDSDERT
jgi:hypothetical protein